jgi:hypothetical protein
MRFMTTVSFVLAMMTVALQAGPASAARIWYVASNGVDTALCGTTSRPCGDIGYTIELASPGDRIVVGPGTYSGFWVTKPVIVESTHGAGATVIQGVDQLVVDVWEVAAGAVIGRASKGFTIRGADRGVNVMAADVVIEDNILTGVRVGVNTGYFTHRFLFTGNVVAASGSLVLDPDLTLHSAGVEVRGPDSSIIHNVFQGDGIGLGVHLLSDGGGVISDNVVTGAGTGLRLFTPEATVRRNTFAGNGVGIEVTDVQGGVDRVISANNFLGNAGASGNCGVLNESPVPPSLTGNHWGSVSGPGAPPADTVCGIPGATTPFLKAPVAVTAPAGR